MPKQRFRYYAHRGAIDFPDRESLIRFLVRLGPRPDGDLPDFTDADPPITLLCPNGHPYTEEDKARTGKVWRCRQCHRENRRRYKAKKRGLAKGRKNV
jgi:hypothetical protein